MKTIAVGASGLTGSAISLGCMRIADMEQIEVDTLIKTALDNGINFFDHADIYGGGRSESAFGRFLKSNKNLRDSIKIQTKCGIRKNMYDFSKDHIVNSLECSLKRLNTDYVDCFILHRPDALMEPEEVAQAFDKLYRDGKVRHFGVSNHNAMQIWLLMKYLDQPIAVNQMQLSAAFCPMIDEGFNVNTMSDSAVGRSGGVLDFCRLNDITIQAWSPFHSEYGKVFFNDERFSSLNKCIDRLALKKGVDNSAIAAAWILRHPAKMQVIIGTTNRERVMLAAKAAEIELTREEWYEIYLSAGKTIP